MPETDLPINLSNNRLVESGYLSEEIYPQAFNLIMTLGEIALDMEQKAIEGDYQFSSRAEEVASRVATVALEMAALFSSKIPPADFIKLVAQLHKENVLLSTPELSADEIDREVIRLISLGNQDQEIGRELGLSHSQVRGSKRRLFAAYDVHRPKDLIVAYLRAGNRFDDDESERTPIEIRIEKELIPLANLLLKELDYAHISETLGITIGQLRRRMDKLLVALNAKDRTHACRIILENGGPEAILEAEPLPEKVRAIPEGRPLDCMQLISTGWSTQEIMTKLGVSESTVREDQAELFKTIEGMDLTLQRKSNKAVYLLFAHNQLPPYDGALVDPELIDLNDVEKFTLLLLAEGFDNVHISQQLGLRLNDTSKIVTKLMETLDAKNRTQLGRIALEIGVVDALEGEESVSRRGTWLKAAAEEKVKMDDRKLQEDQAYLERGNRRKKLIKAAWRRIDELEQIQRAKTNRDATREVVAWQNTESKDETVSIDLITGKKHNSRTKRSLVSGDLSFELNLELEMIAHGLADERSDRQVELLEYFEAYNAEHLIRKAVAKKYGQLPSRDFLLDPMRTKKYPNGRKEWILVLQYLSFGYTPGQMARSIVGNASSGLEQVEEYISQAMSVLGASSEAQAVYLAFSLGILGSEHQEFIDRMEKQRSELNAGVSPGEEAMEE